jgi:SAM-dependent methyltransferase
VPALDLDWSDGDLLPPVVYPDTVFLFTRMTEATLEMLAGSGQQRVLDVGCGSAVDCSELERGGCWVVGLDPSETMLKKAQVCLEDRDSQVLLVRAIGEQLPFRNHSFDRVMCKGALDHLYDPVKTIAEMARVLKPSGKVVISIANFASLSCRLVKREIPADHNYRFDYPVLKAMMKDYFEVEECMGVSLLWGSPLWGRLLAKSPARIHMATLKFLDRIARRLPALSDVIVLRCCSKPTG